MRSSSPASMTTRQKMTIGIFIIVLIIIAWQLISMFKSNSGAPDATLNNHMPSVNANPIPQAPPPPHAVSLFKPPLLSEREIELIKLQKQTEEKYIASLNQLQMLKVERDIVETNRAIVAAKLDIATAEKNMANLLQPPVSSSTYAQGLANPSATTQNVSPTVSNNNYNYNNNYIVISVSFLQGRWGAVLGSQGKLYQIYIGDVLPNDGAKVVSIDRSGVVLQYGQERKKISLVPII